MYDVAIAGGGTAGAVAAISAARAGLEVIVIESMSALGGTQTFSLVTPFMEHCLPDGSFVNSSISEEIIKALREQGHCEWLWFDPEYLKLVLEEKVLESGAEILYDTSVIGVECTDGRIGKVKIYNSDGVGEIKAKTFIDCTGDADLAKMCGAGIMSGNRDGVNQSASLRFEMANVDLKKMSDYLKSTNQPDWLDEPMLQICNVNPGCAEDFKERAARAVAEGRLTAIEASHLQMFSVPGRPGVINFNCPETGTGKHVSSAAEKTKRYIKGRKSVMRIAEFMRSEVPGFANAYVSMIAPMLGIRESERIIAEYEYSIRDIVSYRRFDDAILRSAYPVDVHGASSEMDGELEYPPCETENRYFEYPYRSLIPKGIKNLLVCGRCSGCDFYSQSALRIQLSCQAMGEAAGIAARLAVQNDISFSEVDGVRVREIMRERGSDL